MKYHGVAARMQLCRGTCVVARFAQGLACQVGHLVGINHDSLGVQRWRQHGPARAGRWANCAGGSPGRGFIDHRGCNGEGAGAGAAAVRAGTRRWSPEQVGGGRGWIQAWRRFSYTAAMTKEFPRHLDVKALPQAQGHLSGHESLIKLRGALRTGTRLTPRFACGLAGQQ